MITRTTFTTTFKYVKVDMANRTFTDVTETVNGNYNNENAIEQLKKLVESKGIIAADFEIVEIKSELRGMSDDKWLLYSEPIHKNTEFSATGRGRKRKTETENDK